MKISKIMKANPIIINPAETLEQAAQKMREIGTGVLPVGHAGEVEGMLTDRDITVRAVATDKIPSQSYVHEVMTREVVSCTPDCSINRAFNLMIENDIGRLVVIDADNQAVGIVSLADLINEASDELRSALSSTEKNHHSQPMRKSA